MKLEQHLFEIEQQFWLGGEAEFIKHLGDQCLLAFPQAGQMHGIFARADIARTAQAPNRWRDLSMTNRHLLQITDHVAAISYRADVRRANGEPYAALVGSIYAHRGDSWRLVAHQHAPI